MNTKKVIITKASNGWSVKELFHWEGWPVNEGNRHEDTLAWAVFNATDSAARHKMVITSITINGEKPTRAKLEKLIGKVANGLLEHTRVPAIASLAEEIA
ncbi:MAG: hypothetical protein JRE40_04965 [Deltaproteobacteria bacterium]|nr:hypothetical protein [Deltaproteobacteria bacterium]